MSEYYIHGEMPTSPTGEEAVGYFYPDPASGVLEIAAADFEAEPEDWDWGTTATIAGGTFTLTKVGDRWEIRGTPTIPGYVENLYVRMKVGGDTWGPRGLFFTVYTGQVPGYSVVYPHELIVRLLSETADGGFYLGVKTDSFINSFTYNGTTFLTNSEYVVCVNADGTWRWVVRIGFPGGVTGSSNMALRDPGSASVDFGETGTGNLALALRLTNITQRASATFYNADGTTFGTVNRTTAGAAIYAVLTPEGNWVWTKRVGSSIDTGQACQVTAGHTHVWGLYAGIGGRVFSSDDFTTTTNRSSVLFKLDITTGATQYWFSNGTGIDQTSTTGFLLGSVETSGDVFVHVQMQSFARTVFGRSLAARDSCLFRLTSSTNPEYSVVVGKNTGMMAFRRYGASVWGVSRIAPSSVPTAERTVINTDPQHTPTAIAVTDLMLLEISDIDLAADKVTGYWRTVDNVGVNLNTVASIATYAGARLDANNDNVIEYPVTFVGTTGSSFQWGGTTLIAYTLRRPAVLRFDISTRTPLPAMFHEGIPAVNMASGPIQVVPGIYGGGFVSYEHASVTSTTPIDIQLEPGTGSYTIPGSTTTNRRMAVISTFDSAGVWQNANGPGGTPEGDYPPDPPFALSPDPWPPTKTEDETLTVTVGSFDPSQSGSPMELLIRDPLTGDFRTTPITSGTTRDRVRIPGKGWATIRQYGDAEEFTPDYGTAEFTFEPDDGWYGSASFDLQWKIGDSFFRKSAVARFTTTWNNIPEKITSITGEMPEIDEDGSSLGTFTATDPDLSGDYTWQLSPQTESPRTTTGSAVEVLDDDGNTVGIAEVWDQNDANRRARIRFSPIEHWNGTAEFSIRANNNTGDGWSNWITTSVTVNPTPDAPTGLTPTLFPDVNEDETVTQVFSWTDPDTEVSGESGSYTIQLSLNTSTPGWLTVAEDSVLDLGDVLIRVLDLDVEAQTITLRAEPKANWYGPYSLKARVVDDSEEPTLFGPSTTINGYVISVPDAPGRVTPFTMPRCRPGQTVSQVFTTIDPDPEDDGWFFEISSSPDGTWLPAGSSLTIPGLGVASLFDSSATDKSASVAFTALENAYGRYSFWLRVSDDTGRYSTPSLVTGYVVGIGITAFLQRIDRSASPAVVKNVTPLTTISSMSITDALEGPGSATVTVAAAEIANRADALNMSPTSLIDPHAYELAIYLGSQPLWVGPLTGGSYDAAGDGTVTLYASGLLSYFESVLLDYTDPKGKRTYTNTDQSAVVWDLVDRGQGTTAATLALTNGTVPSGTNTTIEYDNTATIADAMAQLRQEPAAAEVWIDPDRTVRASATRGGDKRHLVVLNEGLSTSVNRSSSSDDIVTVAVVTTDNHQGYYIDNAAVAQRGVLAQHVHAPQLTSNAACTALAREIVLRSKDPVNAVSLSIVLDPFRSFYLTDIEPGDVVRVDVQDPVLGRIAFDARIINMTTELVSDSSDTFVVSLDVEPAVYVDGVLQGSRSRHVAELYSIAYEALYRNAV